jgi:transposase-like protein
MLDGIELKGRCCIVALGIDVEGVKHPLGLWDGSTENATVATTLLANLVERGLDVEQGVLVVLDGAKALRKAVRDVLGVHTPVQRCVRHYADARVMPTRRREARAGGGGRGDGVGIIRSLRGTRGARRVAGSGPVACRAGWSSRALVP